MQSSLISKIKKTLLSEKPRFASALEWDVWYDTFKKNRPFAYFLTVSMPRVYHRLHMKTIGRIRRLRSYCMQGFVRKSHALTSSTLEFGQWHELDERILHCLMDELVNFVEIELAHMWQMGEGKKSKRSKEDGIAYLNWAVKLTVPKPDGTDEEDPTKQVLSGQALDAIEIQKIYLWWTVIRPNRKHYMEESGLRTFWREMDIKYGGKSSTAIHRKRTGTWRHHYGNKQVLSEEEQAISDELFKRSHEIEQDRDKEDEDMLINLIRIRSGLWT